MHRHRYTDPKRAGEAIAAHRHLLEAELLSPEPGVIKGVVHNLVDVPVDLRTRVARVALEAVLNEPTSKDGELAVILYDELGDAAGGKLLCYNKLRKMSSSGLAERSVRRIHSSVGHRQFG